MYDIINVRKIVNLFKPLNIVTNGGGTLPKNIFHLCYHGCIKLSLLFCTLQLVMKTTLRFIDIKSNCQVSLEFENLDYIDIDLDFEFV